MKRKESLVPGVVGALIASLCCLGPLVIILLGLGSASTAMSLGYRKPYFLLLGVIFFLVGFYYYQRKNWCGKGAPPHRVQIAYFLGPLISLLPLY